MRKIKSYRSKLVAQKMSNKIRTASIVVADDNNRYIIVPATIFTLEDRDGRTIDVLKVRTGKDPWEQFEKLVRPNISTEHIVSITSYVSVRQGWEDSR